MSATDSFDIRFQYDPAIVDYEGFEAINPVFLNGNLDVNHTSGNLRITFHSIVPVIPGSGEMIRFKFTGIEGTSNFIWDPVLSNYFLEGTPIASNFADGKATFFPVIEISFRQMPELVCPESFDASVIATVKGGTPPYTFQWVGSPIQVLSDSIGRGLAAGGAYTLRITDAAGCFSSSVFRVRTRPSNELEISASPDTIFISNPVVTFTVANNSEPVIVNYRWWFGDGDSIAVAVPTVTHTFSRVREYAEQGGQEYEIKLVATNEFGCDTTLLYPMIIKEVDVFIPNVFTPNGDGTNDLFEIVRNDRKNQIITNEFQSLELQVFNRWGRVVYDSSNYLSNWDGGNLSDGVYYYVLRAHGFFRTDIYRGVVHIIR